MWSNPFIQARNWRMYFALVWCIGSSVYAYAQDLKGKDICVGDEVNIFGLIPSDIVVAVDPDDNEAGWYVNDEWQHEPSGFTVAPTETTTYTLRFTTNGTLHVYRLTITVHEPPILTITPSSVTICSGESVYLNAKVTNATTWTKIHWTYNGFTHENETTFTPHSTGAHTITATADNTPNTDPHLCPLKTEALLITVNFNPGIATGEPGTDRHCPQETINLNDCIDFFVHDKLDKNDIRPADDKAGTITWFARDNNNNYSPVSDPENVTLTSLTNTTFYADLGGITVYHSSNSCTPTFAESVTTTFLPVPIHIISNYFVLDYGYDEMCYGDPVEANIRLLNEIGEPSSCATIDDIVVLSEHSGEEEILSDTERTLEFPPFTGLKDTIKVKVKGSLPGLDTLFSLYLRKPMQPDITSKSVCINTDAEFLVVVDDCDVIQEVKWLPTLSASTVDKTDNVWTLRVPELSGSTLLECTVTYFSKLEDKVIEDYPLTHTLQIWEDEPELSVFLMYDDALTPFEETQNLCLGDSLLFVFSIPHDCDTIKSITGLEANGRFTYQGDHTWEAIVKPTTEGDITYTAQVSYKQPKGVAPLTSPISYTVTVKERPHPFVKNPPNSLDILKYCYTGDDGESLNLNIPPWADIIDYNFVEKGVDKVKFLAANGIYTDFQPKETGNYVVEATYQYLCSEMTTTLAQDEVRIVVNSEDEGVANFIELPNSEGFCITDGIIIKSKNSEGSELKWEHDGKPVTFPYKPAAGANTYTLIALINNACYPDDPNKFPVTPIRVAAVPQIKVMPDDTVCYGATITLEAEYEGDELIWTTAPPEYKPIPDGIVTIYNTTTFLGIAHNDGSVCPDATGTVTITRMPDAKVKLMSDTEACLDSEVELRVEEKGDEDVISWSDSHFVLIGEGETITVPVNGHETYTAKAENWCSSYTHRYGTADLKVTALPLPYVALKADTSICYGESLNLDSRIIRSEGILQWTPDESTAHTITEPTTYIATVSTTKCGSAADTMYVDVYPPLLLLPDNDNLPHYNTRDAYDVSFQVLHAEPDLTYNIYGLLPPGLRMANGRLYGQPVLGPADYNTHRLQVSVIDGHRCKVSKEYILAPEWKAANVLLPMGDEGNKTFLPDYSLEVFNRNGLMLHKGMGWNGYWNNALVPAGTYFYKAKILIDGAPEERMSYVVVMYY